MHVKCLLYVKNVVEYSAERVYLDVHIKLSNDRDFSEIK